MPQIDKAGFLEIVTVSTIFCFLVFLTVYIFIALPQFSSLRSRFDIFRVSFTRLIFTFLDKTIGSLLKITL